MVKNQLEKKFSESYKADPDFWGMKLHNNPLAHQNTPADYILDYCNITQGFFTPVYVILVECKQVTCAAGENGRLAFKRLKQMTDLITFKSIRPFHKSYFCIAFKEPFWANSEVYLLSADAMQALINSSAKVSINREEMKTCFKECQVPMDGNLLYLGRLKED